MKWIVMVIGWLGIAAGAGADVLAAGTWIKRVDKSPLIMSVKEDGKVRKITYRRLLLNGKEDDEMVLTVETKQEGEEAPVLLNGKPTGQTMSVRRVDDTHVVTLLKFEGREIATSTTEISADGRVLKDENETKAGVPGQEPGTQVVYWDRY
jgi:hypothetical protein